MEAAADVCAGALLVKPGLRTNTVVVPRTNLWERAAELLGCHAVERWPYAYQLDAVHGLDGRARRFEIIVDESGLAEGREVNVCASLAAHPLNEAYGNFIFGPALLVPLDGAAYTLEDWDQICKGVWSLDCDCEDDCGDACPRVALVEANVGGPLAANARA